MPDNGVMGENSARVLAPATGGRRSVTGSIATHTAQ